MSIRTTFVMVIFLSVVAGYFLLADFRNHTLGEPVSPWFYTANVDDITRIHFTSEDGKTIGFYQDESDKNWRFDDEFAMPVDNSRWGGIAFLLSGPQSRRALFSTVEDPARFGLDTPLLKVNVSLLGNRTVNVSLGDKTPDSINYYIIQEGNPGLYLINGEWGDVLSRITTVPPYPSWYYKIAPEKVLYVRVNHDGKEQQFRVERIVGEPFKWYFVGKDAVAVDMERWNKEIQPKLGGPPNLKLFKKGIGDPKAYGVDAPVTQIQVEYLPPVEPQEDDPQPELRRAVQINVGKLTADGKFYYVQPDKEDYIMTVDKDWVEAFAGLITTPPQKAAVPAATP